MKTLFIMIAAMAAFMLEANAQIMKVIMKDGTQANYLTSQINQIVFSDEEFTILGTWRETHQETASYTMTNTITFKDDGTFTLVVSWSDTTNTDTDNGTYTFENDTLTLQFPPYTKGGGGNTGRTEVYKIQVVSPIQFIAKVNGEAFTFNKIQ